MPAFAGMTSEKRAASAQDRVSQAAFQGAPAYRSSTAGWHSTPHRCIRFFTLAHAGIAPARNSVAASRSGDFGCNGVPRNTVRRAEGLASSAAERIGRLLFPHAGLG